MRVYPQCNANNPGMDSYLQAGMFGCNTSGTESSSSSDCAYLMDTATTDNSANSLVTALFGLDQQAINMKAYNTSGCSSHHDTV